MRWLASFAGIAALAACGPRASDRPRDDAGVELDAGITDRGVVDAGPPPARVLVARVFDGDTIELSASSSLTAPDGQPLDGQHVRLIGIDTPEIEHPPEAADCYGDAAAAYTREALLGSFVTLEYDTRNGYRDRYGRLLAYVLLEGEDFNARLARTGNATVYRSFNYVRKSAYIGLESQAKSERLGLWSACR